MPSVTATRPGHRGWTCGVSRVEPFHMLFTVLAHLAPQPGKAATIKPKTRGRSHHNKENCHSHTTCICPSFWINHMEWLGLNEEYTRPHERVSTGDFLESCPGSIAYCLSCALSFYFSPSLLLFLITPLFPPFFLPSPLSDSLFYVKVLIIKAAFIA